MLEIEQLSKQFGGFRAVNNCSFSVQKGTITGLVGPNGAGKTTTFNLIAGALQPTAGKIKFLGEDVTRLSSDQLFHKGLVRTFQIPHEFHRLSALENLMLVPPAQKGESLFQNWLSFGSVKKQEEEVRQKALETLEFLELSHVVNERAGNLSGGQKKLLELGRTMMTDAKLVLLDEPAAGVNRTLLRRLEDKIQILNQERGYTFVLIEHDMEMIEKLCDPVICMAEGSVLIEGDFQTVRSDARVLEAYLGETVGEAAL
ncbi:Lipopolysaccharide export system ATP-binding protein LptB [Pseudovibrio sp. W64]|uniref:ABC transporter ATP-binding protein n=1 Tax=unclassified Pseudovibrio TaxID=2627060 RepID=UPI00070AB530|nr:MULTISPECIES: ABC transporter ATP-binding protein [unclassified Pseudovibrio]KZK75546.1 Lipopolysaccharide export system ATP-binding protein LptB [Pseudovibrio sp. W64]KZL00122.1 Lipopolysaccharide export system ATP-binding protein LptB [Pseudovibrio sp. Ad5]KZL01245.1 Lipopolysaccharide export system ATP-binding protein LptB [Pseudovibrio sp. W74]KZL11310.1 Lipopolysaccharide export system ATP-binding protein LptB [Pseudovibrio sp. Ad14]